MPIVHGEEKFNDFLSYSFQENFGTAVQDNEHMFRMYTISVPKGTLTKGDNCSVKITSVSVGGAIGGRILNLLTTATLATCRSLAPNAESED